MKTQKFISLVTFVFLFSSCTYRLTDFTIISTKNVDLSKAGQFKRNTDRVVGKDVTHVILFFPIGRPNMKEAIDRAIETTRGAVALVDGVVYSKAWWAILYGQSSFVVEGTPLIDPSLAMNEPHDKDTYTLLSLDRNGKVKKQSRISPEAFSKLKAKISHGSEISRFKSSRDLAAN